MGSLIKKGIAAFAVVSSCYAGNGYAIDIPVTLVAGHPATMRWVKHLSETFIPTANEALADTDHQLVWTTKFGGSLVPAQDTLEAIGDGSAQLGIVSIEHESNKLPTQNVTFFTPFVSADGGTVSDLIDALHRNEKPLQQAWHQNGLEYLGGGIGIDDYLLMTKFPIENIHDLAGRTIAAPGPTVNWLKGTGAVSVPAKTSEFYAALEAGEYDGVIAAASDAVPGKIHEMAPFITRVGFGGQYTGGIAANKRWYEGLPLEVQGALKLASGAQRKAYHHELHTDLDTFLNTMQSSGASIRDVDKAFRKAWADGMQNVARQWAEQVNEDGLPGTEVLDLYMNTLRDAGALPLRDWDKD